MSGLAHLFAQGFLVFFSYVGGFVTICNDRQGREDVKKIFHGGIKKM